MVRGSQVSLRSVAKGFPRQWAEVESARDSRCQTMFVVFPWIADRLYFPHVPANTVWRSGVSGYIAYSSGNNFDRSELGWSHNVCTIYLHLPSIGCKEKLL